MTDDLPVLPGFREMAQRARREDEEQRRALVADLVARRRAAGLSQGEVAERMGTSQPAIARLEAGQVDARMSTVQRYAAAVGARIDVGGPSIGVGGSNFGVGGSNIGGKDTKPHA